MRLKRWFMIVALLSGAVLSADGRIIVGMQLITMLKGDVHYVFDLSRVQRQ